MAKLADIGVAENRGRDKWEYQNSFCISGKNTLKMQRKRKNMHGEMARKPKNVVVDNEG